MPRFNTEYIAKLQNSHLKRTKLSTDIAIFKEDMQKSLRGAKKLDE